MAKEILRCTKCNSFTLQKNHCNTKTITIKPAKYSPLDKWGKWRRKAKQNDLENKPNL